MAGDRITYFHRARETAPFCSGSMGERELVAAVGLSTRVIALEPGQRYEPGVDEEADRLHVVLEGRGAFVVGDARKILEAGDVAFVPAGVSHRVFANQNERLSVLVTSGTVARREADESPAEAAPVVREEPKTVVVSAAPAAPPVEIPVTRSATPTLGVPAAAPSSQVQASAGFARMLDDLRAMKSEPVADTAPEIPSTIRTAPRTSRVREAARAQTIDDLLPAAFRKPTKTVAPPDLPPAVAAAEEPEPEPSPEPQPAPAPAETEREEAMSPPADSLLPDIFRRPSTCSTV